MAIALYSGIAAAQAILAGDGAAKFQQRLVDRLRPQFHDLRLAVTLAEIGRHGGELDAEFGRLHVKSL
jgi:hypothetical protein